MKGGRVPTRLMPFSTFLQSGYVFIQLSLCSNRPPPQLTASHRTSASHTRGRRKPPEGSRRDQAIDGVVSPKSERLPQKNEVMIELDTFYNRNSQQNLIPVTGGVALVQTTRRFVDNTIIARYGF
jgi:hypothetical protein